MHFKNFAISALVAIGAAAKPLTSRDGCVVLSPGTYIIASAQTGWLLRPFHHAFAPPAIDSHQAGPTGQLGVWSLTKAPESAYYISNVGENSIVATLSFSGLQPYTTTANISPVAFAIQCAGNGTYVIKNPIADGVWTAEPDEFVKIIGANGDISQRFIFHHL